MSYSTRSSAAFFNDSIGLSSAAYSEFKPKRQNEMHSTNKSPAAGSAKYTPTAHPEPTPAPALPLSPSPFTITRKPVAQPSTRGPLLLNKPLPPLIMDSEPAFAPPQHIHPDVLAVLQNDDPTFHCTSDRSRSTSSSIASTPPREETQKGKGKKGFAHSGNVAAYQALTGAEVPESERPSMSTQTTPSPPFDTERIARQYSFRTEVAAPHSGLSLFPNTGRNPVGSSARTGLEIETTNTGHDDGASPTADSFVPVPLKRSDSFRKLVRKVSNRALRALQSVKSSSSRTDSVSSTHTLSSATPTASSAASPAVSSKRGIDANSGIDTTHILDNALAEKAFFDYSTYKRLYSPGTCPPNTRTHFCGVQCSNAVELAALASAYGHAWARSRGPKGRVTRCVREVRDAVHEAVMRSRSPEEMTGVGFGGVAPAGLMVPCGGCGRCGWLLTRGLCENCKS